MRIRSISLVLFLAFAATACASDINQAVPGPGSAAELTTTSVVAQPSSTSAPATTSTAAPETVPTTEAAASLSAEEAVSAVHNRFMTEVAVRDERIEGDVQRRVDLAQEITTGALLSRIEGRPERILEGAELIVGPGYLSNIVSVEVIGEVANVLDCSQDRTEGYSQAGELTTEADDFFKVRGTRLVEIGGQWFVEDFFTGGDDRCDPAALQ